MFKRGVEPLLFVVSCQAEQLGSAPVPPAQTKQNTIDSALALSASNQRDRPLAATAASKSKQIYKSVDVVTITGCSWRLAG